MGDPVPGVDAWSGPRVARWLKMADGLERQLAPVAGLLAQAAALEPGERVLDVGCGVGPTTRDAAGAVGPSGSVTGLDLSAEMIAAAEDHPVATGSAPIRWVAADATVWDEPDGSFDAVISRFGVMFFEDPLAAFTNLARVSVPGGRLHVAVWAHRSRCELFDLPLTAVLAYRASAGLAEPPVPGPDEGPFSLSDDDVVAALVSSSGWRDPMVERHRVDFRLGGGLDADHAGRSALDLGPSRAVTADLDETQRSAASAAVTEALVGHVHDGEVVLGGEILVVSAYR